MEEGNLEIIIKDIETGEELAHDQASFIQAYVIVPEDDEKAHLCIYLGGAGGSVELSQIYRNTRDDVLEELWGEDLEKIKATSKFCKLFEAKENKEE